MSEKIRCLMIATNHLIDEACNEVKHLLTRRLRADEVVDTIDLERLCDVGEHFIFPVARKAVEQDAHVRPAEVECEIVAALLARRESQIGRQHAQGGIGRSREAEAHVLSKSCCRLMQMLRIYRKRSDNIIVKHGIKCHIYSSSWTGGSSCSSATVCRR